MVCLNFIDHIQDCAKEFLSVNVYGRDLLIVLCVGNKYIRLQYCAKERERERRFCLWTVIAEITFLIALHVFQLN